MKTNLTLLITALIISTTFFAGCGGSGSGGKGGTGTEIPGEGGSQYSNPQNISTTVAEKPAEIKINLPGAPEPMPEGLLGFEIWRGPASGFSINSDGMSATNGAVKIADSRLSLPSGTSLSDAEFTDRGGSLVYVEEAWSESEVSEKLVDGTEYKYIVRYVYPENNWSSGVVVAGTTMAFSSPQNFNIFPSAPDNEDSITVTWNNPANLVPFNPDKINIYRQSTPFIDGDITQSGQPVASLDYSSSLKSWKDTDVFQGNNYYYYVAYEYESDDWGENHLAAGVYSADPAAPGSGNSVANLFADQGSVTVESINGQVEISWTPSVPDGQELVVYYKKTENPVDRYSGGNEIFAGSGIGPLTIDSLTEGVYSYGFYFRQTGGAQNYSDAYQVTAVDCYDVKPVTGVSIARDSLYPPADITVSYTIPEGASWVTIEYKEENDFVYSDLKTLDDNWSTSSAVLSGVDSGTYYFKIKAVFDDNAGGKVLSSKQDSHESDYIAISEIPQGEQIIIAQSSQVEPENCQIPYTYNFDQVITFETDLFNEYDGVVRYTENGTNPDEFSEIWDPENELRLQAASGSSWTYDIKAEFFIKDENDNYTIPVDGSLSEMKTYIIDYEAYDANFIVYAKESGEVKSPNAGDHFTRSEDGLAVYVEYTPGCGEMFSIYHNEDIEQIRDDFGIGNSQNYNTSSGFNLPEIQQRMDNLEETVTENRSSVWNEVNFQTTGRDYSGGHGYRAGYFLKIAGRDYADDPGSGANPDLIEGSNFRTAPDIYVVYPKLNIKDLDMFERPAITPYLWTRNEPVVTLDVERVDFFTETPLPAENVNVTFNVQYAYKNHPYGQTQYSKYTVTWINEGHAQWDDNWPWNNESFVNEDLPDRLKVVTGQNFRIIVTDPIPGHEYYTGFYGNETVVYTADMDKWGASGNGLFRKLTVEEGQAYYQIYNKWDIDNRIGSAGHYADVMTTGEIDSKSFRTAVRFRVRAGDTPGYRNSEVLRSFENETVAAFDVSEWNELEDGKLLRTRNELGGYGYDTYRMDRGTLANADELSDMPEGFRSYPIEVYQHYEGWGSMNPVNAGWYQKQGIKWFGDGLAGAKNNPEDSRFKHFDYSNPKVMIYSHGWQNDGHYHLPVYKGWGNSGDQASDWNDWWNNTEPDGEEWHITDWRSRGFNVAIFHWNKLSQGTHNSGAVPGAAEEKIWAPISDGSDGLNGSRFMAMHRESTGDNASIHNAMADATRSASVGMLMAQEVIDSLPPDYTPEEVIFSGHSLGANVIMNAAQKLIINYFITNDESHLKAVPTRIELLDPYWADYSSYSFFSSTASATLTRDYSHLLHYFPRREVYDPTLGETVTIGIPI